MADFHYGKNGLPSVEQASGFILDESGGGTLIVDADAFLIVEDTGLAARLFGPWSIAVNGEMEAFGTGFAGIHEVLLSDPSDVLALTVGNTGDVFGGENGLFLSRTGTVTNSGTIAGGHFGIHSSARMGPARSPIKNSGLIEASTALSLDYGLDTINNSGTISDYRRARLAAVQSSRRPTLPTRG